nr:hypothetical protein [uncultured Pseudomonas sp.]
MRHLLSLLALPVHMAQHNRQPNTDKGKANRQQAVDTAPHRIDGRPWWVLVEESTDHECAVAGRLIVYRRRLGNVEPDWCFSSGGRMLKNS